MKKLGIVLIGLLIIMMVAMFTVAVIASVIVDTGEIKEVQLITGEVIFEDNSVCFCNHVDDVPKLAKLYLDTNYIGAEWEVFSPAGNYTREFGEVNIESVEEALAAFECIPENYEIEFEGNIVSQIEVKDIIAAYFSN